jgi:CRISPR-associated protein Cas6/Cse3/CasE subtype I-E
MYKTRIVLSIPNDYIQLMKCLKSYSFDDYTIHKFIYSLFPKEENADFIYDAEYVKDNKHYIIIYSSIIPDVPSWLEAETVKINKNEMTIGNKFKFFVNLNPVSRHNGKNCKSIKNENLNEWLNSKDTGVNFLNVKNFYNYGKIIPTKTGKAKFRITRCSGVLEVIDAEKFEKTLLNGLGKGKSFGIGMLKVF